MGHIENSMYRTNGSCTEIHKFSDTLSPRGKTFLKIISTYLCNTKNNEMYVFKILLKVITF